MLSIGLMSGTSMDGIDASLLETDGEGVIKELASANITYSSSEKILLKSAEKSINQAQGDLASAKDNYLSSLESYFIEDLLIDKTKLRESIDNLAKTLDKKNPYQNLLGIDSIILYSTILHAELVEKLLLSAKKLPQEIGVIGYHGQTMYHNPDRQISLQIGDGALLAKITGIMVVNNFRNADIKAGGQGAPFAPVYHQALATRDNITPLIVANCGGIANLTVILDNKIENLIGFDTGPGNGLIDALVKKRSKGLISMDFNGQYGAEGKVNQEVLDAIFEKSILINQENYFEKSPPKSLDIRDMKMITELNSLSIQDACKTLEVFTADSIVSSLDMLSDKIKIPSRWILAGGGWHNPIIKNRLIDNLYKKYGSDTVVKMASEIGWNGESLEAQVFAYLAVRSLKNLPLSYPGTTRVTKPISGGVKHYPL